MISSKTTQSFSVVFSDSISACSVYFEYSVLGWFILRSLFVKFNLFYLVYLAARLLLLICMPLLWFYMWVYVLIWLLADCVLVSFVCEYVYLLYLSFFCLTPACLYVCFLSDYWLYVWLNVANLTIVCLMSVLEDNFLSSI